MVRCNFKIFIVFVFLLFLVPFTPSLIADQKVSNQPSKTESLLVQSCRLNQNVLVQAASMNQRGQGETNRLYSPDHEGTDKPSFKSSIPQSTIQNLSLTLTGDPKYEKSEVIQKTQKLRVPFIANDGQTNERVKFYANTFGGTVFVTKDGEIVYSLPASKGGELRDKRSEARSQKLEVGIQKADARKQHKNLRTANSKSKIQNLNPQSEICNSQSEIQGVALKEELVGARVKTIQGEEKSITNVNYFKGKDPSKWKTNVSTYETVSLGEVYEGIELKLKAYGSNVEKLFCVKPGADPQQIKVRLGGVNSQKFPLKKGGWRGLSVNEHGELEAETELGPVKFTKPVAYQEIDGKRVDISAEYRIESSEAENKNSKHKTCNSKLVSTNPKSAIHNSKSKYLQSEIRNPQLAYGFTVASYDKTKDLIIDPLLASTLLGASGNSYGRDYGKSIVINPDGDIYVTGYTSSSDFPTTTGAYDTFYNNSTDIFISQLNSDLTSLLASTYFGGSGSDYAESIEVDSSGNVYVTGYTYSSDFPTIQGAYDTICCNYFSYTWAGGEGKLIFGDTFVLKLNGSLTSLPASTYLGGSDDDYGNSISVDTSGNVYVFGYTSSSDFPTTEGAYSTSSGYYYISCDDFVGCDEGHGDYDVFISKLNGELTTLLSSTCLGGEIPFQFPGEIPSDYNTIAIDSIGNIYVAGYTDLSSFPTTTGVYDTSYNGSTDAFVSKLSGDLTTLLASTFLGGANPDYVSSISIDANGDVYVTGYTYSSDFPITTSAYDTSYNDSGDVFVSKLSGNLTTLLASTYFGGSGSDYAESIEVDSSGNVYVAGYTYSSDFPAIQGAYDTSYNDASDIFVSKLDDNLTNLISSTYLGGTEFYSDDYGSSITVDSDKNIYIVGYSNSSNFPMDTKTYDTSYNGSEDIFVSKLNADMTSLITSTYLGGSGNDYGSSMAINEVGNIYVTGNTYSSDFPTTTGAYDTSYNDSGDVCITKLSNDLTSILASTILGGSGYDYGNSLSVGSSGNVYVSGTTYSSDFPTTTEAYDTSYNNSGDVFISKLSGNLTELLASTFLGGSEYDAGIMAIDSSGNIYTAGSTRSVDFPVTLGAYDISFNTDIYNYGYVSDAFVSKLNGDLTNLLASTFLGGYEYDNGDSVSTDLIGNVYVAGYTSSPNFPISPVALHAYYGDNTAYISKFDSNLTSLISSTYLESGVNDCISTDSDGNVYVAGSSSILKINDSLTSLLASASLDGNINSIALDSDGNIYVAGSTDSTEFQTTTGAYDTYNAGDNDAFVSKFDSNLSSTSPTVTTGAATDIKSTSATLKGSVNANGASTDVWFEYDTTSGSYSNTTSTQSLSGLNGTDTVSIDINGLSLDVTYYYRIVAQNGFGTSYGSETSFTTSLSKGTISGYVSDIKGNPIESVKLRLKGKKTKTVMTSFSNSDGFFEFTDLDVDAYVITATKKGYKRAKRSKKLEEGEEKEIKIVMKKTSKRGR